MSPGKPTRTLPWSGTLVNTAIANLAPWLQSWDSYQATVAMAAINAVINPSLPLLSHHVHCLVKNSALTLVNRLGRYKLFLL
ncbi:MULTISPECIES: DUF4213 domain-containing protein [Nostocales]|uniref:DUF4213 domain-containing protein n=2 Tax=Nostocales TaxID=1161 RepID=A0ABW8WEX4_9CYAN|nr:DUF4213 domain-containing protein [Tolypothrix bouteillei]